MLFLVVLYDLQQPTGVRQPLHHTGRAISEYERYTKVVVEELRIIQMKGDVHDRSGLTRKREAGQNHRRAEEYWLSWPPGQKEFGRPVFQRR